MAKLTAYEGIREGSSCYYLLPSELHFAIVPVPSAKGSMLGMGLPARELAHVYRRLADDIDRVCDATESAITSDDP